MNQKETIQERLDAYGMSWHALMKATGIPKGTLYHIKSGRLNARAAHIINPIAKELNLDPTALIVAGNNIPHDVEEAMIRHPELIHAIRRLARKLDSQNS